MLRIKSAQYMTGMPMPAKPMPNPVSPEESQAAGLDPQFGVARCKMCQKPKYDDDLPGGFCDECLGSGMVKPCSNCGKKGTEEEMQQTQDGWACSECLEHYQGSKGEYTGPRRDYFSGPAELY